MLIFGDDVIQGITRWCSVMAGIYRCFISRSGSKISRQTSPITLNVAQFGDIKIISNTGSHDESEVPNSGREMASEPDSFFHTDVYMVVREMVSLLLLGSAIHEAANTN